MLKRKENKSVSNMKRALWADGLIMTDTMVYQSKQKLKETQAQFLPNVASLLKMKHAAGGEVFWSGIMWITPDVARLNVNA